MKFPIRSKLPLLALVIFSLVCMLFVEDPPYPVSAVHTSLVFFLAAAAYFYACFGQLRNSAATYCAGVGLATLSLLAGLFPDMWLRWPAATQISLSISTILAFSVRLLLSRRPNVLQEAYLLIAVISILPVAILPYWPWPKPHRGLLLLLAPLLLSGAVAGAWYQHQARPTLAGILSWAYSIAFVAGLAVLGYSGWLDELTNRWLFEQVMLFGLLIIAGGFMTDLLQIERQLRSGPHLNLDASLKDALTDLANRRALELHGPQLIRQSRDASRAVSLIIADIDFFKEINDTHGHLCGDDVLRQTAQLISAQVRKSDLVARYGGEEFVIILPGALLAPALRLAEKMRSAAENHVVMYDGKPINLTVSFGVATAFPEDFKSLSQLIEKADANLYRAKRAGRNCVMSDALPSDAL